MIFDVQKCQAKEEEAQSAGNVAQLLFVFIVGRLWGIFFSKLKDVIRNNRREHK